MKNAKVLQWKLANILSSISFTSFSTLCFFLVVALFFNPVLAADVTDVADAFDGADPFDANVNVSYIFDYNTGSIARENFDTKSQTDSPLSNFPVNDIDVFNFTRTIHKIQLKTEIGLYKDLSFFIKVPIEAQNSFTNDFKNQNNIYVLKQNPVKYNYLGPNKEKTANILRERNLIDDDSTENTNFTDVRKGIGDMSLGFKWGAFNYQRDETKPNWTLGIEYTIPTGIKMEPYRNSGVLGGVGRGIHSFNFSSAFSKRIAFVEPYLKFDYTVNIVPNSAHGNWRTDPDCLSTNNNKPTKCGTVMENVLSHIAPGQRGTLVAGAEFIPWENLNKHQNIKIDLRFWGGFNSKGRELSQVSDLLNEATFVEQYSFLGGMIGFYGQVLKFVGFKTSLHFNRDSSHYLTIEKTGSDHNSNGKIEQDLGEKNNDYNESYDQIGKRFKLSSDFTMAWMFTTIIMF